MKFNIPYIADFGLFVLGITIGYFLGKARGKTTNEKK